MSFNTKTKTFISMKNYNDKQLNFYFNNYYNSFIEFIHKNNPTKIQTDTLVIIVQLYQAFIIENEFNYFNLSKHDKQSIRCFGLFYGLNQIYSDYAYKNLIGNILLFNKNNILANILFNNDLNLIEYSIASKSRTCVEFILSYSMKNNYNLSDMIDDPQINKHYVQYLIDHEFYTTYIINNLENIIMHLKRSLIFLNHKLNDINFGN